MNNSRPFSAGDLIWASLELSLRAAACTLKHTAEKKTYHALCRVHEGADRVFYALETKLREGQKGLPHHAQLPHHRQL